MKTLSEQLFERFCSDNEIVCIQIVPDGQESRKHPDYSIECSGNPIIVEVKEFGDNPENRLLRTNLNQTGSTGEFDPHLDRRARKRIDDAMPQLRRLAKGKLAALVVLFDNENIIPLSGLEIRLAMYGQDKVDIFAPEQESGRILIQHRFGPGQKVTPQHNTTLSAVALLQNQEDQQIMLEIYHNRFAAIPFNPNWLRIPPVKHFVLAKQLGVGGLPEWQEI